MNPFVIYFLLHLWSRLGELCEQHGVRNRELFVLGASSPELTMSDIGTELSGRYSFTRCIVTVSRYMLTWYRAFNK